MSSLHLVSTLLWPILVHHSLSSITQKHHGKVNLVNNVVLTYFGLLADSWSGCGAGELTAGPRGDVARSLTGMSRRARIGARRDQDRSVNKL